MVNLVFVVADEFRQQALGFLNEDPVLTKNLDNFAKESAVFLNAFSNYPVCSPYRGMLFTGKYPYKNGVIGNCNSTTSAFGVFLRDRERCLSDLLYESEYETGYIGKWHLDAPEPSEAEFLEGYRGDGKLWDAYTPPGIKRHGFQFWHSYGCCDNHNDPHYWHNDASVEERIKPGKWSVEHETDVAVSYILNEGEKLRDPQKPFALFLSYNPPHMPFEQVPERYVKLYEDKDCDQLLLRKNVSPDQNEHIFDRTEGDHKHYQNARANVKNYFAAVSGVDENFGRILKALEEAGCTDNTIVVFTADHGEMMGSHGMMYKSIWYDESFKLPFLIRYPGHIPPGFNETFLNVPDLMPSLWALLGQDSAKLPPEIDGEDKSPWIVKGQYSGEACQEAFYLSPAGNLRGLRTPEYFLIVNRDYHNREKYLLYKETDKYQLENLAAAMPQMVQDLRNRLDIWLKKTEDVWSL